MNQLNKPTTNNLLVPPNHTIVESKSLHTHRNKHLDEPPVLNFYDSSNSNFQTLNDETIEPMHPYNVSPDKSSR